MSNSPGDSVRRSGLTPAQERALRRVHHAHRRHDNGSTERDGKTFVPLRGEAASLRVLVRLGLIAAPRARELRYFLHEYPLTTKGLLAITALDGAA